MSGLTDDEWEELRDLVCKVEACLKAALGAALCNWSCLMNSFFEHSRHLEKWGIPASTLQLTYGDVSPYTEAAGSTGVVDSDSSCPIVMVCCITCLCRIPQVLSESFF
ncbi:MAG: hypothetical protein IK026_06280, partial [Eubacteriaceae bacterium]|nr:hypothetical protein [Eubacteriaceae bacterium]